MAVAVAVAVFLEVLPRRDQEDDKRFLASVANLGMLGMQATTMPARISAMLEFMASMLVLKPNFSWVIERGGKDSGNVHPQGQE